MWKTPEELLFDAIKTFDLEINILSPVESMGISVLSFKSEVLGEEKLSQYFQKVEDISVNSQWKYFKFLADKNEKENIQHTNFSIFSS